MNDNTRTTDKDFTESPVSSPAFEKYENTDSLGIPKDSLKNENVDTKELLERYDNVESPKTFHEVTPEPEPYDPNPPGFLPPAAAAKELPPPEVPSPIRLRMVSGKYPTQDRGAQSQGRSR
jgi:hypothetical protein